MKALNLTLLLLFISLQCYGQLHTFEADDPVSAKEMNENFQHLEKQFRGTKSIDIDCDNGGSISAAIANGFNDITVLGTCSENLRYTVWRDDSVDAYVPSGKFAPRFLKITGKNQSAKIKDASSNSESLIYAAGGLTIFLKDIILEGGRRGVVGKRNSNLLLSNVTVSSFRDRGVDVQDSSYLGIDEGGVIIIGTNSTETDRGLNLGTGSTGWVSKVNISNVKRGITLYAGSFLTISQYLIKASKRGIEIQDSGFDDSSSSDSSIEGSNEFALKVSNGSFYKRKGKLEIKNLIGGRGIDLWQSKAQINTLKLLDFDNTGSGWNPAIRVGNASALNLNNSEVSGETDWSLISVDRSSMLEIGDNSSISGTAGDALIYAGRESLLDLQNSKVSGTAQALIGIDRGSTLQIESGTISGSVEGALIGINHGSNAEINNQSVISITSAAAGIYVGGSNLNFKNSSISGSVTQHLIGIENGSDAEISDSTLTLTSGKKGLSVAKNSHLKLRNSSITGPATDALVQINRVSSVDIENGSSLVQTNADTPDVKVEMLSFLGVWDSETSINKVNCYNKGYVSANEGTVTDLAPSCTE